MTPEILTGLQRVYRGLVEGVALMPPESLEARALEPLIKDIRRVLASQAVAK